MPSSFISITAQGFVKQRRGDRFALRVALPCGVLTADQAEQLAQTARQCGDGLLRVTMKQGMEIGGISMPDLPLAQQQVARAGLQAVRAGPYIEGISACCGAVECCSGIMPTEPLARRIQQELSTVELPAPLSIAIAGCPNACTLPLLADLGLVGAAMPEPLDHIEGSPPDGDFICPEGAITYDGRRAVWNRDLCIYCGQCTERFGSGSWPVARQGFMLYAGGRTGRHPKLGTLAAEFLSEDEAFNAVASALNFYSQRALPGERLSSLIDRLGIHDLRIAISQKG